jgi:hypothetical protein
MNDTDLVPKSDILDLVVSLKAFYAIDIAFRGSCQKAWEFLPVVTPDNGIFPFISGLINIGVVAFVAIWHRRQRQKSLKGGMDRHRMLFDNCLLLVLVIGNDMDE